MCVGQIAFAQDSGLTKRVDLYLKDAELLTATQMLTKQTGLQFVISPTADEFKKINLSLADVTAEQAISYICEAAGAYATKDENGVFIIRHGSKVAAEPKNGGVANTTPTKVKKPLKIERIKIMKGDPELIYEALTTGVISDPEGGLKKVQMWSKQWNEQDADPYMRALNQGRHLPVFSPSPTENPSNSYPRSVGKETANGVELPGEAANQFGGGGRPGGGFGGGQQGGGAGGGQNQQGGGQALAGGTGFVPEGITKVTYDPQDNSLIVEGTDEAINALRSVISLFDVAPKQVIIKVEFITTSTGLIRDLGMDWLYQRGAIVAGNRPGSFAHVGDPIFINYATGNVTTRLRQQISESGGKTVNAPLIRTLNNQTAVVQQVTQTTMFLTTNQVTNGIVLNQTVPVPITVQTGLAVKPRVNDDGTVTMFLTPQIQDFGQVRRGPDGQEIPDRLGQQIAVVARVKSGSTIALGGMTRKQYNTQVSRFPILSELPLIGNLFKSTTTQRTDSELIIFVTPLIIEDDDKGGFTP